MRFTRLFFASVGLLSATFALTLPVASAFAQDDKDHIRVGVRGGTDEEIFEVVSRVAAEEGLTVEGVVITGTVSPNEALHAGDLDANSFQHVPFLNSQIEARGYDIVPVGDTYVSPIAIYSQPYDSVAQLPQGARIGIPDDLSNQTRALLVLDQHGLIELRDGVDPYNNTITLADIESNPHDFELIELTSTVLARTLEELDAAIIVNSFAFQVGLLATRDGIALEPTENNPYINVIAVRSEDTEAPWVSRLVDAYQSDEVRQFIEERYEGSVIPVF